MITRQFTPTEISKAEDTANSISSMGIAQTKSRSRLYPPPALLLLRSHPDDDPVAFFASHEDLIRGLRDLANELETIYGKYPSR